MGNHPILLNGVIKILVKCRICGTKIERNDAFKIISNGKNLYYCNKNEYNEWKSAQEIKDNTYNLIYEIFGRKITNTILFKEIGALSDIYSYDKIFAFLSDKKKYLSSVMDRDFKSEYAQIRYFAAILKNSLSDFTYKKEENIKKVEVDIPNTRYKRNQRRKTLAEYEEEVGDEL